MQAIILFVIVLIGAIAYTLTSWSEHDEEFGDENPEKHITRMVHEIDQAETEEQIGECFHRIIRFRKYYGKEVQSDTLWLLDQLEIRQNFIFPEFSSPTGGA